MLPTANTTISVSHLSGSDTRSYATVFASELPAYIEYTDERLEAGYDGASYIREYRMMTDAGGSFDAIVVSDRITDTQGKTYSVKHADTRQSLVGAHREYILTDIE